MHNDLWNAETNTFDRSAIMKYAIALARIARKHDAEGPDAWSWHAEMSLALMKAWQRAHALRLCSLGVVKAGGREVASWEF